MSTSSVNRFAAHLVHRIGGAADAPSDIRAHATEACGPDGFATLLAPDSADGIAAVLAECSAEGWPVAGVGAATWLSPARARGSGRGPQPWTSGRESGGPADPEMAGSSGDSRDDRPPVLLSTIRLDRTIEHEPADLVIGVQAGVSLERLNATLAAQRQWLPLDPPAAPVATIGAVAACGDSGPLRAGHGAPRDMALGIEVATGDGRLLRFGGRVVKNVAGYDGVRLLVGSRGSLGIITALYLRVRGAPRAHRTLAIATGGGADGARRGAELALAIRERVACDALELLSPAVVARLAGGLLPEDPELRGWQLLIRLLGGEAAVTEGVERVTQAAGYAAHVMPDVPAAIWAGLSRLEAEASTAIRISGSAAALGEGLATVGLAAQTAAGSSSTPVGDSSFPGDGWLCAAHAADGIIRLWRTRDSVDGVDPTGISAALARTGTHGWTVRYDRGRGAAPDPAEVAPDGSTTAAGNQDEAVRALTQRLRNVFDPAGILIRGTEL